MYGAEAPDEFFNGVLHGLINCELGIMKAPVKGGVKLGLPHFWWRFTESAENSGVERVVHVDAKAETRRGHTSAVSRA